MEPDAVTRLFAQYIACIEANVLDGAEADERLMRSVESEMDVTAERKDAFRRALLNYIGALAIEGKAFEARTNPRLFAALQKVVDPTEPLAERGLRLLREGAGPVGVMTITAAGVARPNDDAAKLLEARTCLEQALAEGDTRAALPLASMLREGLGGPADAVRARALYAEIFERSQDPRAAVALALMTAHGEGGPPDRERGYALLRPVAATGDLRAVAALLDLAGSPDEIAEAERFGDAAKQALIHSMS